MWTECRRQKRGWLRIGLVGLLALSLLGCHDTGGSDQLARLWLDALNSHDPERVLQLLEPDATYSEPSFKQPLKPEGLRRWLTQVWSTWKDRVYSPGVVVADPTMVVIEWHIQQTHPNGTAVPLDGITLIEHDRGRIRHVREYYNAAAYLQFLPRQ